MKVKKINELLGITETYKAPEALLKIVLNYKKLNQFGEAMLKLHDNKLDYDWFHEYFQNEHADRKLKKQDFTPRCITELLTDLNPLNGLIYESCGGTGGIIISHWNQATVTYGNSLNPADRLYFVEELSERAIPFLLFNLAIRGVNAIVVHCDVLSRKAKSFYHVFNIGNDITQISDVAEIEPHKAKERLEALTNFKYELVDHL